MGTLGSLLSPSVQTSVAYLAIRGPFGCGLRPGAWLATVIRLLVAQLWGVDTNAMRHIQA